MSLTNPNPAGWGVGDTLTPTQINLVGTQLPLALDKSSAGDNLSGVIAMDPAVSSVANVTNNGGRYEIQTTVATGLQTGYSVTLTGIGGTTGANGTWTITVLDATHFVLNGSSFAGSYTSGGTFPGAQIQANASFNILASAARAIQANATGAISSNASNGGIALNGGANDWPTFGAAGASPRTRTLWVPGSHCVGASIVAAASAIATSAAFASPASASNLPAIGGGVFQVVEAPPTSGSTSIGYLIPIHKIHDGATISAAALTLIGSNTHSALPATQASWGLWRVRAGTAAPLISTGSGYVTDSQSTVAAYKLSHTIALTPTQNNVIDVSQDSLYAIYFDEFGSNATALNTVVGILLTFSSIADMRFP